MTITNVGHILAVIPPTWGDIQPLLIVSALVGGLIVRGRYFQKSAGPNLMGLLSEQWGHRQRHQ